MEPEFGLGEDDEDDGGVSGESAESEGEVASGPEVDWEARDEGGFSETKFSLACNDSVDSSSSSCCSSVSGGFPFLELIQRGE